MARVIGPSLSLGATKSLGKTLTFQKRPSGHAVYLHNKPGDRQSHIDTPDQYRIKPYVSEAVRHWHLLTPSQKVIWNEFVK